MMSINQPARIAIIEPARQHLREVKAELEAQAARGVAPVPQEPRFELMEQSGKALRDEAEALCEHACDGMDFRSPPRAESPTSTAASDEGDGQPNAATEHPDRSAVAVVRHRFDKPDREGRDRASRRVVTLRDRRMGRRHRVRHGSDPPA
jgi:hypothetical protein